METPNYPRLANISPSAAPQKKSRLPLAALILTFVLPLLLGKVNTLVEGPLSSVLCFAIIFSPVAGMLLAIISLCLGKKRIGADGVTASLVVLLAPVIFIAILWIFFASLGPIDLSHM